MAENPLDELKEQRDISEELLALTKEQVTTAEDWAEALTEANNIEKDLAKKLEFSGTKAEILHNVQNEISKLAKDYRDALEDAVKFGTMNDAKMKDLATTLSRIKTLEGVRKSIQNDISISKETEVQLYKALGLENIVNQANKIREAFGRSGLLGSLMILTIVFEKLSAVFDKVDSAAADFRITMGFIRDGTGEIEDNVRAIYFQLAQSGVQAKDLYAAFQAVAQSVGSARFTTSVMASDIALMTAQLGVAAGNSAEFARVMGMMGRTTMDAQKDISIFAAKMSEAAGTKLDDVMSDVANASKSSYQFLSRNPLALAKAAIEAKKMGTSISEAAKSADSLIRFTESVKNEMEASVLLGESINLQRARELAYRKDISGLNKEILDIAKKTRFEELDPFQQEAVAKALGKSADELGKMLQADREMLKIRRDPSLAKQVAEYDKLASASDSLAKSTAADYRLKLSILSNQKAITAVTTAWTAIWQRLLEGPVKALSVILPVIAEWLGKINYLFKGWGAALVGVAVLIGVIVGAKGLGRLVSWVTGGIGKAIKGLMGEAAEGIGKFGKVEVMKGALGLFLVGAALIPFIFAMKQMTGLDWKSLGVAAVGLIAFTAAAFGLGALISTGVGAVLFGAGIIGILALGAALIPLGFAAKLAGAGMKDLGVGLKMSVDSLVELSKLSFIDTIISIKNLTSTIIELSKAIHDIPKIELEPLRALADLFPKFGMLSVQKTEEQVSNKEIVDAIKALNADLRSGKLVVQSAVFLDSQRVDSAQARALAFKGTLTPQPTFA